MPCDPTHVTAGWMSFAGGLITSLRDDSRPFSSSASRFTLTAVCCLRVRFRCSRLSARNQYCVPPVSRFRPPEPPESAGELPV